VTVTIVGGLDIHRAQLTFDYIDLDTGEVCTGRIAPADRERLRDWLSRFVDTDGDVSFALEGCTGWRYVVEELGRAGVSAHVAEPAETAALKGKKSRAKTDRADARHLRSLLVEGRIPESWIPPADVLDARVQVRLYKDLLEERTSWFQRVQATLYHHGVPHLANRLVTEAGRRHLAEADLPDAARLAVEMGMRQIERLSAEMLPLRQQIAVVANHQPGCKALQANHYGVGPLTSAAIWSEMGDCRRFSSSDDAVRHAGLDVTVYSSDGKKTRGHLAKQGPPVLRWALYEAAVYAGRPSSPDHAYFSSVKNRLDGQLALLSMARKLARRCYHTLRNLGDAAFPAVAA
jgi:transposase